MKNTQNRIVMEVSDIATKLEIELEKVFTLAGDIDTNYFGCDDAEQRNFSCKRFAVKLWIVLDYLVQMEKDIKRLEDKIRLLEDARKLKEEVAIND